MAPFPRPGVRPFHDQSLHQPHWPGGFQAIYDGLNLELLRQGPLSPDMCAVFSLVNADVSGYGPGPVGLTAAQFKEQAIEENGLFKLTDTTVDDAG